LNSESEQQSQISWNGRANKPSSLSLRTVKSTGAGHGAVLEVIAEE